MNDFLLENIHIRSCNMPGMEQIQCILAKALSKFKPTFGNFTKLYYAV